MPQKLLNSAAFYYMELSYWFTFALFVQQPFCRNNLIALRRFTQISRSALPYVAPIPNFASNLDDSNQSCQFIGAYLRQMFPPVVPMPRPTAD